MIDREGIIYTRVSTAKQVTDGSGLEGQEASCRRHAKENDIKILKVFSDGGFSGRTIKRPALVNLFSYLKQRKNHTFLIVDDLSRVSRNNIDYYELKRALAALNTSIISVKDKFDDSAQGELIENIQVSINTFNRRFNNEILKSRMLERLKDGYWMFSPPVGLNFSRKVLVEDDTNSKYIKKIYQDFANGKYITYKQIKDSYEAKSLTNKNGQPFKLKDRFIKRMLSNNLYRGVIHYPKWGIFNVEASHRGFISSELFESVQDRLRNKKTKKHSSVGLEHFPLKGEVECGFCNKPLVASYSKGRNKKYPYYRCNSKEDICSSKPKNISRERLHNEFLGFLQKARINRKVLKLFDAIMEDAFHEQMNQRRDIQETKEFQIKKLKAQKQNQIRKVVLTNDQEIIKAIEDEIVNIKRRINELEASCDNSNKLADFKLLGQTILTKPDEVWRNGSVQHKKAVFNLVFEKNIRVLGSTVGTPEYTLPFKLLMNSNTKKGQLVEPRGIEPLTSTLPALRSPS